MAITVHTHIQNVCAFLREYAGGALRVSGMPSAPTEAGHRLAMPRDERGITVSGQGKESFPV